MPSVISEHQQWFDAATGELLVNGNVYIGASGLDPEVLANQITIYSDRALTTAIANPQTTDANGQTSNKIYVPQFYSIAVTNSADVTKYSNLDNGDGGMIVQSEEQTATAGQTVITLADLTYAINSGNVLVYINGVKQASTAYTETSTSSITLSEGLDAGDLIEVMTGNSVVSTDEISSSLVSYDPAGAGAVQTTSQAKHRESVSVFDFMTAEEVADVQAGTALVDVTAAVQAAIDHIETLANGGLILFPAGSYVLSATLTVTGHNIVLQGEGQASILVQSADYGDVVKVADASKVIYGFEIRNFQFDTSFTPLTSGAAIHLDAVRQFYIDSVVVDDGFIGVQIMGCGQGNITNCTVIYESNNGGTITGRRFMRHGVTANVNKTAHSGDIFIDNFNGRCGSSDYCETGVLINAGDGIWFDNFHIGNCTVANVQIDANTVTKCVGMIFRGGWLDLGSGVGFKITGSTPSTIGTYHIKNNKFAGGATCTHGIDINGSANKIYIEDNEIGNYDNHGVYIRSAYSGSNSHITGNTIIDCSQSAAGNANGILFESDTDWVISKNIISGDNHARHISVTGSKTEAHIDDNYLSATTDSGNTMSDMTGTDISQKRNTNYTNNYQEVVTATNVILGHESGKTFYLDAAGGFTSTLPALAVGLKYTFIVTTAPTTAYIITTDSGLNRLYGTYIDIVGELTYFSAQDTLNFVASTSVVGDRLEVECDGTNWYCKAISGANGGITTAVS